VQPAQPSLLPDQVPAPLPTLLAQLPEGEVAAAITLLARLIAKAAAPETNPITAPPAGTPVDSAPQRGRVSGSE
jgi:hypothetical protein